MAPKRQERTDEWDKTRQSPQKEEKEPQHATQQGRGRKRPRKPSPAQPETKNPAKDSDQHRPNPTSLTRPDSHNQNPQMPRASSPLNHSVTGLGLELIPHCPMRAHGCQESAEPNSTPWGTHEEVPTPNGGNPSYHRV